MKGDIVQNVGIKIRSHSKFEMVFDLFFIRIIIEMLTTNTKYPPKEALILSVNSSLHKLTN
ncbi:hypothetical protein CUN45_11555 [Enterococcus faecium]|nr:hypothetical protein CUN37_12945 [Enterococcus faecium]PQC51326.1 hypothetical protein CUN45_11555 [Enterococcus faecium]